MAKAGGSNRDVIFTIRVKDDGAVDKVVDRLSKKVDDLQRKMHLAMSGAGMGGGGGSAGTGSGSSVRTSGSAGGRGGSGGGTSSIDRDFTALEKKWEAYERKRQQEEKRIHNERQRQLRELRSGFGEALEGVTSLARGFVLLGVSGEENIEKALRSLAKFEAVAQMLRGSMKISNFAGKGLEVLASRTGIAAGGGAGTLGAAALAAGVGVLGGGLAIRDQINYSRTGQIGGFSQTYANLATSAAGGLQGYGIDPRAGGLRGFASHMIPGAGILSEGGFYGASDAQQRTARATSGTLREMSGRLQEDLRLANIAQDRLTIENKLIAAYKEQATAIRSAADVARGSLNNAAAAYGSLNPYDQKGMLRLRDRVLRDPTTVNDDQLNAVLPFTGGTSRAKIIAERNRRAKNAGVFDEFESDRLAVDRESEFFSPDRRFGYGAKYQQKYGFDPRKLKSEIKLDLKIAFEANFKQFQEVAEEAFKESSDEAKAEIEKLRAHLQEQFDRINSQRLSDLRELQGA